jgi:diketogulonate reductase-like aldo/keto reductase
MIPTEQTSWNPAADAIDPALVPSRRLYTGAHMPAIGLGTFGSDHVSASVMAEAVREAAAVGYRHFDCAAVYGNEAEIGRALTSISAASLPRQELWITSKLWNDKHAEHEVIPACRKSLADLGLDYLDLYLVHWPFPNFHPPGCDVHSRGAAARPYIHESFMKTWRQMEKLVDLGLVRHIGTSNMTVPKLRPLLHDCRTRPAVNEMEMHPHFQQPELFEFLCASGIQPVAYCPLGSPGRPERDRTPEDTVDMDDPIVRRIAHDRAIQPSLVCLKWALGRGAVPIPMSTNREHFRANLLAAAGDPLSAAEMEEIAGIDRGCRLIKGQVFLWKANQSWEDLWDIGGEIAS